jgi:hypothetical protein
MSRFVDIHNGTSVHDIFTPESDGRGGDNLE